TAKAEHTLQWSGIDQYKIGGWGCRNIDRGNMYLMLMVLVLVLHLLLLPVYLYLTWHHRYWQRRGLITAKPLTVLGTYPGLLTRRSNLVLEVQRIYNQYKYKYRAVGVFVTRQPQILVLDPALAHEVLVENYCCYRDSLTSSYMKHATWEKYAGRNPFWASGSDWRRLRSEAQAGLSSNRLKQGYAIWEESGKKLINFMAREASKQQNIVETRDLCFRYTADVMCDFIWGIDAGTLSQHTDQPNKVQEMASKWTNYVFHMITIFMASIVAPISRRLLRMRFYPKDTDEFFSNLTKASIDMRLNSGDNQRVDYLSYLLKLQGDKKHVSHDDLVGHALTVMLDGYDTTATALLHALYYLSGNAAAQQKLRTEILRCLEENETCGFEQLSKLPYLEQVVYGNRFSTAESLRLSSVVPQYTKVCTHDTTIKLNDFKSIDVEKGITILIPNYQFHHDAKYFPRPEAFHPERFDNGAHHEFIRKGMLLPFSDGPRICMGMRLALLTLKSALFHIISEYQVVRSKHRITIAGTSGFGIVLNGDIKLEYRRLLK
ncbi:hypothetical protein KR093_003426, partial [Drosophila rubida]